MMLLSAFLIVIHLGFASATALASTMIAIVISVLLVVKTPDLNAVGMTMILQFVVSFGFILPVNAPQNMIAYGTGTFDARDFVRTGLVITLAASLLLVVFSLTYWPWMGYLTLPESGAPRQALVGAGLRANVPKNGIHQGFQDYAIMVSAQPLRVVNVALEHVVDEV